MKRRAEIIVPGALVLRRGDGSAQLKELVISDGALARGLIRRLDAAPWPDRRSLQLFRAALRQRTVERIFARRFPSTPRASRVTAHALTLSSSCQGLLYHDRAKAAQLLLGFAAMLHTFAGSTSTSSGLSTAQLVT